MNNATDKQEILEAIHAFAEQVDRRFSGIEGDMNSLKIKVASIESRMVDKTYLDDKIADLRGDLIALSRKEDVKLSTLVEELVVQGSLSRRTADRILALEPFARSS